MQENAPQDHQQPRRHGQHLGDFPGSFQQADMDGTSVNISQQPDMEQHRKVLNLGAPHCVCLTPCAASLAIREQNRAASSSQAGGGEGRRRWAHVECPWGCQASLIRMHLFHNITAGWFISQSFFERLLLTEGRGRDLGWVQTLVQLCLSSPRFLAVRRAGPPAVPSPAFTAALPVRTNGTAQKINSSHLYDNTAPPVRMLHHCF